SGRPLRKLQQEQSVQTGGLRAQGFGGEAEEGGGPPFSSRGNTGSKQAQSGALPVQMVTCGLPRLGSSRVPARAPIWCLRVSAWVNIGVPQVGQNVRCISVPLSAWLV